MRFRTKVWVSPEGDRYAVGMADTSMSITGRAIETRAYVFRDEGEVRCVVMTPEQWDDLPFSWFVEQETDAPRPPISGLLGVTPGITSLSEFREWLRQAAREVGLLTDAVEQAIASLPNPKGLSWLPPPLVPFLTEFLATLQ